MANNDRKQLPKSIAPRWGAISYVFIFLSLSTSYGGARQKSTKSQKSVNYFLALMKDAFILELLFFMKNANFTKLVQKYFLKIEILRRNNLHNIFTCCKL